MREMGNAGTDVYFILPFLPTVNVKKSTSLQVESIKQTL